MDNIEDMPALEFDILLATVQRIIKERPDIHGNTTVSGYRWTISEVMIEAMRRAGRDELNRGRGQA